MDAKEAATAVTTAAAEKVEQVKTVVTNTINQVTGSGRGALIFMLLVATMAAFFVVGVIYYVVYKYISVSTTYIVKGTDTPVLATKSTTLSGSDIPAMNNGKRITVSWWMYINDMLTNDGQVRRVFNHGTSSPATSTISAFADYFSSTPFVALDPYSNKVHVVFATTNSPFLQGSVDILSLYNITDITSVKEAELLNFMSQTHGMRFDYVPMQRWVHLAVVVDEEANGGTVTGYLDGELVKTVTTNQQLDSQTNQFTLAGMNLTGLYLDIHNLNLSTTGNINIGGDGSGGGNHVGFSGLVSRISFTNTDLNANDIWQQYRAGPTNLLNQYGLNYGLQSPIYRLS
jgi:hypothetical protein